MSFKLLTAIVLVTLGTSLPLSASETLTVEPGDKAYNFVSHYRVVIDAPAKNVWKHLVNLRSWMYEFEMFSVSGEPGKQGEVLRLYAGQNFLVQITEAIPNELLVMVNLPLTFKGEFSTGTGVTTLYEANGQTTVDLTMSRRYTWENDGENPMKKIRESPKFMAETSAMWQDRFLQKLRTLAEAEAP